MPNCNKGSIYIQIAVTIKLSDNSQIHQKKKRTNDNNSNSGLTNVLLHSCKFLLWQIIMYVQVSQQVSVTNCNTGSIYIQIAVTIKLSDNSQIHQKKKKKKKK